MICPECGLQHPVARRTDVGRKAASGGRRFILALIVVPLMLSAAYAAHSQLTGPAASGPDLSQITDPVQRGAWLNGMQDVRLALADPNFQGFGQSYVHRSAGQVVSFCGTLPSGKFQGLRFVSVAGDSGQAVIEGQDESFDTLWNRVCDTGSTSA